MGQLADKLRESYKSRVAGEMGSTEVTIAGEKMRIYWKPLTGRQQRSIVAAAEKGPTEGILMHIKVRALDANGKKEFADYSILQMMNDFDFEELSKVYLAMTDAQVSNEDIEKNLERTPSSVPSSM